MSATLSKTFLRLTALVVVFVPGPVPLFAAQETTATERFSGPTVSAHLRAVLTRVNVAFRAGNYELALKETDAADAMQPKSSFDQLIIDQLRAASKAHLQKSAP